MISFVEKGWQAIFEHNGLGSFDALWNLQADWFEPPNPVSYTHLTLPTTPHV